MTAETTGHRGIAPRREIAVTAGDLLNDPNALTARDAPQHRLALFGLPALILVILAALFAYKFLLAGVAPGDVGDARFNLYVLEHTFQWLRGEVPSYISPPLFYPFPGSLFFSVNHSGTAFVYALFRAVGISKFSSFTLWAAIGYAATFVAAYWTLLRFGFTPLPATIGATIFAFSLPSLAQIGHAQLIYRFGVPLAVLSLWNLLETCRLRHALWLITWTGWQMLADIYIGVFLLILLAGTSVWFLVLNGGVRERIADLRADIASLQRFSSNANRAGLFGLFLLATSVAACTIALLYQYQLWSSIYGFKRDWAEISTMIPRPASYLIIEGLPYWDVIFRALINVDVPMRNEHSMFMGLGAFCLFVVGVSAATTSILPAEFRRLSRVMLLALASIVVLTTMIGTTTFYALFVNLPGLNSIRAVTRIVLVTMFPVAIVIASGTTVLIAQRPRLPARAVLGLFLVMIAAEFSMMQLPAFYVIDSEVRTSAIIGEARRKAEGVTNPILFVREGKELPYKAHLDAMLAAQELRWPTLNGYSGNAPPGYEYELTCNSPANLLAAYEAWSKTKPGTPDFKAGDFLARIVYVGWPDCGNFKTRAVEGSLGPVPDPKDAAKLALEPRAFAPRGKQIAFEVALLNRNSEPLSARSFAPVRLSWRFVPDGRDGSGIGWDTRLQIPADVPPGGQIDIPATAELPSAPGTYHLEVSMVAELAYWFHDKGTAVLRFPQAVTVP